MRFFRHSIVLLCLLFCLPGQLCAADKDTPEIKDIIVTTSTTDLLLFASVKDAFSQEMLNDLQQGHAITFTYHLELVKTESWFDSTLTKFTIERSMLYDAASKLYSVRFSEQQNRIEQTDNLETAQKLMAEINGVPITSLNNLVTDAPYAIHFKVTLARGSSALNLHRLLPISALWDTETDWRTIEFRY